ncbi:MAG: hypothetical protein HKN72_05925 [Gemmatimonadetes bacterium]|nr:hypothetical protein [Gemmatimonadota bacterium]
MNDDRHIEASSGGPANRPDADERRDYDEWERMIAAFRQSAPRSTGAPPWLEQKVMAEIEALPESGPFARLLQWLVRPAPVRIPPLAGLAVAAGLALLIALPRGGEPGPGGVVDGGVVDGAVVDGSDVRPAGGGSDGMEAVVYVQFVLEAPGANSVAVAGDFSEWEPEYTLEDVDGDGVWTGRVPVRPGVHTYMFLIDGTEWQTDPRAERYSDDGFGNRNAVLAVTAGT